MMTFWCGVMMMVSVGGGRRAVGGGLGGRLVVAARVLGGGTSGGLAIVDGGGLTNALGSRRIPSGYSVETLSSAAKVTLPLSGSTINSPTSYDDPVASYKVVSNNPLARSPAVPAVIIDDPGVNVLLIEIAIGWPGVSISKRYVCPRYSFNDGFLVSPSLNTYAMLSP